MARPRGAPAMGCLPANCLVRRRALCATACSATVGSRKRSTLSWCCQAAACWAETRCTPRSCRAPAHHRLLEAIRPLSPSSARTGRCTPRCPGLPTRALLAAATTSSTCSRAVERTLLQAARACSTRAGTPLAHTACGRLRPSPSRARCDDPRLRRPNRAATW